MKLTTEKLKEEMTRRVRRGAVVTGLLSLLLIVQAFRPLAPVVGGSNYADFMAGLQMGLLIGLTLVAVYYLAKNLAALRDERKARALIICENDERSIFIAQKIGMSSYKYVTFGLVAAAVAAGYFSAAAMAALLFAALFEVAVRIALYAYYAKKI